MARHILLVHSNPTPGNDDSYNAWYDNVHLPDVLQVDGFVAARRYIAAPSVHGEMHENGYLAIYEIDTDDLPAALKALSTAARGMDMDASFDKTTHQTFAFTELPS